MITIYDAPLFTKLKVASLNKTDPESITDIESRLMLLGLIEGAIIEVQRKSLFFQGPLLVEVRGRLIALNKGEAELIKVEIEK